MKNFLIWYYSVGLKKYFQLWKNFIKFIWNYFSIGRFLRTLFSPWKKDVSRIYEKGIHPALFLKTLTENISTRIIGAIVKFFILSFGLIIEVLAFLAFVLILLVLIIAPVSLLILLIGIFLFASGLISSGFIFLSLFIISLVVLIISLTSFRFDTKKYSSMSLVELSKEKWFERILNRIGLDNNKESRNVFTNKEKTTELLRSLDISPEEFSQIIDWEILNQTERHEANSFWSEENLLSITPIGRYWSYAYTNSLDRYSTDLSALSEHQEPCLIGRENEFNELRQLLTRSTQNKIIITGEPGVGRDTLIKKLAKEIKNNHIDGPLKDKRLLKLNVKEILTEYSANGSGEKMLEALFNEATYAGNIILVLKDIHGYLDPAKKDISLVISQFLDFPTFQIIGTTNPAEFHLKIEKKPLLMKYFENIMLQEMEEEDTFRVILYKIKDLERKHVVFTFQSLREIIKLSDRYVKDTPSPEKDLDILEEILLYWEGNPEDNLITANTVNKALSVKFNIPLGEIEKQESEKLIHLEDHLHQQVVGQDVAIRQIAETMRQARIGMSQKNKPLGSFLFIGPTGVGKTESAKALAKSYFGSEERMIRLDMSEYQLQDSINRLIGSTQTGTQGYLVSKVKESPFSILLLDEIEKAHPDILNLFLQILDEGSLTDGFGKKINFSNLIIIATSNAGAEIIKESIRNKLPSKEIQKKVMDYAIKQGVFRPELLNRFESVIFFHPLNQQETFQVTKLLLEKYTKRLKKQENIDIIFENGLAEIIAQNSYKPEFGARAINRYIKDKVEDSVVKKIISGKIQKGTDFVFKISNLEIEV